MDQSFLHDFVGGGRYGKELLQHLTVVIGVFDCEVVTSTLV